MRARVGADVEVLPVTKGFGADAVRAAAAAGCTAIGENYAQEVAAKAPLVAELGLSVHFIGQLQTNKVRQLAGIVAVYETVDRPRLVAVMPEVGTAEILHPDQTFNKVVIVNKRRVDPRLFEECRDGDEPCVFGLLRVALNQNERVFFAHGHPVIFAVRAALLQGSNLDRVLPITGETYPRFADKVLEAHVQKSWLRNAPGPTA